MNKIILVALGAILVFSLAMVFGINSINTTTVPLVTQQDLRMMIDEWMENPQNDDLQQRLEIMKAYYTFEESGQRLSDDQEGRVLLNQIRKMVSLDIPVAELNEMREEIRKELKEAGVKIEP